VNGISFNRMVVALLFASIFLTACLMPAQSDTYWHLRAGQDIWRTHRVSFVERYSYTAAGAFWPDHEWLWQAASYGLFRLGGMPLLTGVAAATVTTAFVLAYRLMVGAPTTRFALMIVGTPLAACVWALRPQIVSLALLALLVTLIARERTRALPALFVLWANVHGAVGLGLVVLAATAVVAVVKARTGDAVDRRRAWTLALLTPVCAAATALTPLGPRLWIFIFESMQRSHATLIVEWMPAYPRGPIEIGFWVLAAAFLVLLVRRWRSFRASADWADWAVVAAAVIVLPLAARAVRNIPPFLLLAIPAASRLQGPRLTRAPTSPDHPTVNAALLGVFVVAGVVTVAFGWSRPFEILGWRPLPEGALAAVRACPGPLYNHYNEGGYLVWLTPETKVFVDNRQDPYPLPFLLEHIGVESGKLPPEPLFARWGIRCSFLSVDSPTVAALAKDGWRSVYRDDKWTVQALR
jgi:hypothetical protein